MPSLPMDIDMPMTLPFEVATSWLTFTTVLLVAVVA